MEHEARHAFAGVTLSGPDKVLFAGQGLTRADLAAHYERLATPDPWSDATGWRQSVTRAMLGRVE